MSRQKLPLPSDPEVEISGTLAPYTDPDCNCTVRTTFAGKLHGDTIDGTFVTLGAGREQTGRWTVTRK